MIGLFKISKANKLTVFVTYPTYQDMAVNCVQSGRDYLYHRPWRGVFVRKITVNLESSGFFP